jgi:hypothetical protein
VSRAWWAVAVADSADQRTQLARIERTDTMGALGRGWITALRASLAGDAEFAAMTPSLATLPSPQRIAVIHALRTGRPARAEAFYRAMQATGDPAASATGAGELARLDIARGHAGRVDSAIAAGAFREGGAFRRLQFIIVAASLTDIGDEAATARVIADLSAYLPPDSALAYFETRPVWWGGWLIGAHHATVGDTAIAHRWIDAIGTLPRSSTSDDYIGALQADIAARLAVRRGDLETGVREAGRAFRLWSIHADNALEADPAPMMRFHLGLLYREAGKPDSAHAMFRSLVPPTTWTGFLTARASFELGDLETERGDPVTAAFHYRRALGLWEGAGPGAAEWLRRTRDRLAAIVRG